MPKNTKGGKKSKRGPGGQMREGRELILCSKECFPGADGEPSTRKVQCYGQIARVLGGGRFTVNCFDGE